MKLVQVLLITFLIAFAFAKKGDPSIRDGGELMRYMQGRLQGTYILMFYKSSAPSGRTSRLRNDIKSKILNKNPEFHYYEIDADSGEYNDVIDDFMIDETELKHSPTVMVASEGYGYWAHGEGAVEDIVAHLRDYASEKRRNQ